MLGPVLESQQSNSFNSIDMLSQVLNQMEHMVMFQPMWERGYSAEHSTLRTGQRILCCHSFCELSANFSFFLSSTFSDFISVHYFIYLETRSLTYPSLITELRMTSVSNPPASTPRVLTLQVYTLPSICDVSCGTQDFVYVRQVL